MKLILNFAVLAGAVFCVACSGSTVPNLDNGQGTDTHEVVDLDTPGDAVADLEDVRPDADDTDPGTPDGTIDVPEDIDSDGDQGVVPDTDNPVDGIDDVDTGMDDVIGDVTGDIPVDTNGHAARVVVNEIVAKAPLDGPDWVELFNAGDVTADLTGWTMRDDSDDVTHTYAILAGTSLAPGAFLVLEGTGGTGLQIFDFGLGKSDQVRIFDAEGVIVDSTYWGSTAAVEGTSWGRYPDGTGSFMTLSTPTRGAANVSNQ